MAKPIKTEIEMAEQGPMPSTMPVPASPTPMDLLQRAMNSGCSMDIIEKMMAMQERYEANQARKDFDKAMAAAARELPIITKTSRVNFGQGRASYMHADLADVVSTVAPILGKHGLYARFQLATQPNMITVTCIVSHENGHFITNAMTAGADTSGSKNAIQAMGSTQTYLSRYTLMASLGLAAAVDDDGATHQPPQIKPDVMKGGRNVQGDGRRGDQDSDREPAGGGGVSGGQVSAPVSGEPVEVPGRVSAPGKSAKLTIAEVAALENEAREAAKQGSPAFRTFWLNHNTAQERNIITGLGSELAKLRDEADAALMPNVDPETGEVRD
jgi:hypothetical protein